MRSPDELLLDGPIPGASLTAEPGNYPWEQPPMLTDPDEAIGHHISRLHQNDRLDSIYDALEMGISVDSITGILLTAGQMNGIHNVDTSVLIGPVLHEYIVTAAKMAGIDYKDNLSDKAKADSRSKRRSKYMAMKAVMDFQPTDTPPPAQENVQTDEMMLDSSADNMYNEDAMLQQVDTTVAEADPAAAPRGLMSRGM